MPRSLTPPHKYITTDCGLPDCRTASQVSVRAAQSFLGSYWIRNLAIDFADGDRIVLEGTPDEVAYKGIVRLR